MCAIPKTRLRCALLVFAVVLSLKVASAEQTGPPTDETLATITVQASSSVAHTETDEFLAGFISTAMRFHGPRFISCVTNAAKLRPDLAPRIAVCALNIARLNSHLLGGHLTCEAIDKIVRAIVAGAPQSAPDIVKAAIESEPYARDCIITAALAAAPGEESEIKTAASETTPMSMFVWRGRINPVEDLPLGNVNSPEQPPFAP